MASLNIEWYALIIHLISEQNVKLYAIQNNVFVSVHRHLVKYESHLLDCSIITALI